MWNARGIVEDNVASGPKIVRERAALAADSTGCFGTLNLLSYIGQAIAV